MMEKTGRVVGGNGNLYMIENRDDKKAKKCERYV